ncbi:MAG: hypothetical protein O3A31_08255 [Planctomycetota bacterium]|jgi:hypothetical protein|nr:hypothetical protein [Planctomycetota bacterium]
MEDEVEEEVEEKLGEEVGEKFEEDRIDPAVFGDATDGRSQSA